MKITIEKGIPVDTALKQVSNFINGLGNHNILSKKCDIYIHLCDEDGNQSPHNVGEFVLNNGNHKDANEELYKKARQLGERRLRAELWQMISKTKSLQKSLEHATRQYERAKDYGYNTKSDWEEKVNTIRKSMDYAKDHRQIWNTMLDGIENGTIQPEWFTIVWYIKNTHGTTKQLGACARIKIGEKWVLFGNYEKYNDTTLKITTKTPVGEPKDWEYLKVES